MKPKTLDNLLAAWNTKPIADDHLNKVAFHRAAKAFAKAVADDLGLAKGSYTIESNMGGQAVGGETTLHTDFCYVMLRGEGFDSLEILYRPCKGQKDSYGGPNQWTTYEAIHADYPTWLAALTRIQQQVSE